jgi:hypothetical protein
MTQIITDFDTRGELIEDFLTIRSTELGILRRYKKPMAKQITAGTINAIRHLMRIVGQRQRQRVILKINDPIYG